MKLFISAIILSLSTSSFAGRIPFCDITFSQTTEGTGIHRSMSQKIQNNVVRYVYHFKNLRVDASFHKADNKGLILIVDKSSGQVLSSTYATLLDGADETLESYLDLNGATYQVNCKYGDEIPESDKVN